MATGIGAASAPQPPMAATMGGAAPAAPDAGGGDLQALGNAVRQLAQQAQQLAAQYPQAAPQVEQIMQSLKEIVITVAQASQTQSPSGLAVPGGQ
jgi:hypothetical protein